MLISGPLRRKQMNNRHICGGIAINLAGQKMTQVMAGVKYKSAKYL
jgi:hypothetical protein